MKSGRHALQAAPKLFSWVIAVLIPLLIAIGSVWTLSETNQSDRVMTAAIVNEDRASLPQEPAYPTPYFGERLSAALSGQVRPDNIRWVEVSPDQAASGLSTGEYIAVVTIPKGTTENLARSGGEPAVIDIEMSPMSGVQEGYIGKSLAQTAVSDAQIRLTEDQLVAIKVRTQTSGQSFLSLGGDLEGTRDKSLQLGTDLEDTKVSVDTAGAEFSATSKQADQLATQTRDDGVEIKKAVTEVVSYANTQSDNVAELADDADSVSESVGQVSDQTDTVGSSGTEIQNDTGELADSTAKTRASADQARSDAELAENQAVANAATMAEVQSSLTGVQAKFEQAQADAEDFAQDVKEAVGPLIIPEEQEVVLLMDMGGGRPEPAAMVSVSEEAYSPGAAEVPAQLHELANVFEARAQELRDPNSPINQLAQSINGARVDAVKLHDSLVEIRDVTYPWLRDTAYCEGSKDYCDAWLRGVQMAMDASIEYLDKSGIITDASALANDLDGASVIVSNLQADLENDAARYQGYANNLRILADEYPAEAETILDDPVLQAALVAVNDSADELTTSIAEVGAELDSLEGQLTELGVSSTELSESTTRTAKQSREVSEAVAELDESMAQFSDKVDVLNFRIETLAVEVGALDLEQTELVKTVDKVGTTADAQQVAVSDEQTGLIRFEDSALGYSQNASNISENILLNSVTIIQLSEQLDALGQDASEITQESSTTAQNLKQDAVELEGLSSLDEQLTQVGMDDKTVVDFGGLGLVVATFVLAGALWAGAVAIWAVEPTVVESDLAQKSPMVCFRITWCKGILPALVQAVLVTVLAIFIGDITGPQFFGLLGIFSLISLTFMTIVHAIHAWFGDVGRILSIGILGLALINALSNSLPVALDVFMALSPMSPALTAIRSFMLGSVSVTAIGILVFWIGVGALAGLLAAYRRPVPEAEMKAELVSG